MVTSVLELCKVLLRLDMPSAAIEQYSAALQVCYLPLEKCNFGQCKLRSV